MVDSTSVSSRVASARIGSRRRSDRGPVCGTGPQASRQLMHVRTAVSLHVWSGRPGSAICAFEGGSGRDGRRMTCPRSGGALSSSPGLWSASAGRRLATDDTRVRVAPKCQKQSFDWLAKTNEVWHGRPPSLVARNKRRPERNNYLHAEQTASTCRRTHLDVGGRGVRRLAHCFVPLDQHVDSRCGLRSDDVQIYGYIVVVARRKSAKHRYSRKELRSSRTHFGSLYLRRRE
jgi:hypothetical protein